MWVKQLAPLEVHCQNIKGTPHQWESMSLVHKHEDDFDYVKIVDREPGWFCRGIKKAIHIELEESVLNRNKGRYTIPTIYRDLIHLRKS